MEKLKGKRLLHFGRGGISLETIRYAKSEGAYVIYADNNANVNTSYCDIVDKAINIDLSNIEKIISLAKAENVDAVTSNGSEKDLEICQRINEAIGNEYWHTAEQWQTFMNKPNFRKLCQEHNVKSPKMFYHGKGESFTKDSLESISYPVIVKPIDNSGGRGITVANNNFSLRRAIKKATKFSSTREIIIEEYIDGLEFGLTYIIKDGICQLINCCDKYTYKFNNSSFGIPHLYIFPSANIELFMEKCNDAIRKMILSQGLNNTTIFFQGVFKDNEFYIFESGLRLEGSLTYLINWEHNKQHFFHFLIDYLLKVDTDYDLAKDNPFYDGKSTIMQGLYLKKGKISCITGYDEVKAFPYVYGTTKYRNIGEAISKSNITMNILFLGVRFCTDSKEEAVKRIEEIYDTVSVKNRFHKELIFKHVIDCDKIHIHTNIIDKQNQV